MSVEPCYLFLIAIADSIAPTAEKAQQEPHIPWFLTFCTTPCFSQSTSLSSSENTEEEDSVYLVHLCVTSLGKTVKYEFLNSSQVISANSFIPRS